MSNGHGFIAETLVHTRRGPVPIHTVAVGDEVLSCAEPGGPAVYARVVRTLSFENKGLYCCTFIAKDVLDAGRAQKRWPDPEHWHHLVASGRQHLWIPEQWHGEERIEAGWRRLAATDPGGAPLILHDGRAAEAAGIDLIWRTLTEGVGWMNLDGYKYRSDSGHLIDLRGGKVLVGREMVDNDFEEWNWYDYEDGENEGGLKATVFNLELDAGHGYFVGEMGVLAHDATDP